MAAYASGGLFCFVLFSLLLLSSLSLLYLLAHPPLGFPVSRLSSLLLWALQDHPFCSWHPFQQQLSMSPHGLPVPAANLMCPWLTQCF